MCIVNSCIQLYLYYTSALIALNEVLKKNIYYSYMFKP